MARVSSSDRFGQQAGKPNENFPNTDLFVKAFLKPCEAVHHAIGLLMFESSRFWPTGPSMAATSLVTSTGSWGSWQRAGTENGSCLHASARRESGQCLQWPRRARLHPPSGEQTTR